MKTEINETVIKLLDLVSIRNRRVRVKFKNGSEINGEYFDCEKDTFIFPSGLFLDVPTTIFIKTMNGLEPFISQDFKSFVVL